MKNTKLKFFLWIALLIPLSSLSSPTVLLTWEQIEAGPGTFLAGYQGQFIELYGHLSPQKKDASLWITPGKDPSKPGVKLQLIPARRAQKVKEDLDYFSLLEKKVKITAVVQKNLSKPGYLLEVVSVSLPSTKSVGKTVPVLQYAPLSPSAHFE